MNTQIEEDVLVPSGNPSTTADRSTRPVGNLPTQPAPVPNRPLTLPEEDDEIGDNNFASPEIGAMRDRQEALEIDRREQERIARLADLANRD
jgi:hypothetical protein